MCGERQKCQCFWETLLTKKNCSQNLSKIRLEPAQDGSNTFMYARSKKDRAQNIPVFVRCVPPWRGFPRRPNRKNFRWFNFFRPKRIPGEILVFVDSSWADNKNKARFHGFLYVRQQCDFKFFMAYYLADDCFEHNWSRAYGLAVLASCWCETAWARKLALELGLMQLKPPKMNVRSRTRIKQVLFCPKDVAFDVGLRRVSPNWQQ